MFLHVLIFSVLYFIQEKFTTLNMEAADVRLKHILPKICISEKSTILVLMQELHYSNGNSIEPIPNTDCISVVATSLNAVELQVTCSVVRHVGCCSRCIVLS